MQDMLHSIDKKLAVLEAISKAHTSKNDEQFGEIRKDIHKIQEELSKLKIRVATISSGVSLIIGLIFQYWRP